MQDGGRVAQVEAVGDRDDRIGGDDGPLDVPAVASARSCVRDDPPPDPVGILAVADGAHDSGDAVARHVRRFHREVLTTPASADLRVDEQRVRGRDVDDDLSRSRDRVGGRVRHEHLGTAELRCNYLTHACASSCAQRKSSAWSEAHSRNVRAGAPVMLSTVDVTSSGSSTKRAHASRA